MRRWHTLGSILRGVVCFMKDLMTPLRPSVFGVIISIWFFCTAWRKDLMWGLIVCRLTTRNIKLKLGKCYWAQHYPRTGTWQRTALHSDFSWEERASWLDFLQQYLVLCVWYSGVTWTNFNVPLDVTAGIEEEKNKKKHSTKTTLNTAHTHLRSEFTFSFTTATQSRQKIRVRQSRLANRMTCKQTRDPVPVFLWGVPIFGSLLYKGGVASFWAFAATERVTRLTGESTGSSLCAHIWKTSINIASVLLITF